MPNRQTWQQIQQSYPDEWVVVTDYELSGRDLSEGVVVDHSKDKREVRERSRNLVEPFAVIFTGEHRRGLVGLYVQDLES